MSEVVSGSPPKVDQKPGRGRPQVFKAVPDKDPVLTGPDHFQVNFEPEFVDEEDLVPAVHPLKDFRPAQLPLQPETPTQVTLARPLPVAQFFPDATESDYDDNGFNEVSVSVPVNPASFHQPSRGILSFIRFFFVKYLVI